MNNSVESRDLNCQLYCMKAAAIVAVILRHSCFSELSNPLDRSIVGVLSSYGVFTFFVLSGYFSKKESFCITVSKQWKRLIVPWLFWGSLLFLLVLRAGEDFSLSHFFNHMIGNRSSYYFCSMLLLLKLTFFLYPEKHKSKTVVCILLMAASVASLSLTAVGVLPDNSVSGLSVFEYLNPYLNVLNWVGMFALGVLMKEYDFFHVLGETSCLIKSALASVCVLIVCLAVVFGQSSYFSLFGYLSEFSLFLLTCITSTFFSGFTLQKQIVYIGRNTYPLFFLHYPLLSILSRGDSFRSSVIAIFTRPFVCIALILIVLALFDYISKKLKIEKVYRILTGYAAYT